MKPATSASEPDLLVALERTIDTEEPPQLARLLGDLERVKASVWQRLVSVTITQLTPPATDPAEELRHLTPHQVGALLGLKAAYVHKLCRSAKIPAIKSGKYWMIPVAGLRQWLAYPKRDIDEGAQRHVESLSPRGDMPSTRLTGPAGRPRRSPTM